MVSGAEQKIDKYFWMDGCTHGCMDECMDGQTGGHTHAYMDGQLDMWTDACMDGQRVDAQVDGEGPQVKQDHMQVDVLRQQNQKAGMRIKEQSTSWEAEKADPTSL